MKLVLCSVSKWSLFVIAADIFSFVRRGQTVFMNQVERWYIWLNIRERSKYEYIQQKSNQYKILRDVGICLGDTNTYVFDVLK